MRTRIVQLFGIIVVAWAPTQALMVRVAVDRTMLDGVLALAAQDTAMKQHVMTLVRGMEMGSARP